MKHTLIQIALLNKNNQFNKNQLIECFKLGIKLAMPKLTKTIIDLETANRLSREEIIDNRDNIKRHKSHKINTAEMQDHYNKFTNKKQSTLKQNSSALYSGNAAAHYKDDGTNSLLAYLLYDAIN